MSKTKTIQYAHTIMMNESQTSINCLRIQIARHLSQAKGFTLPCIMTRVDVYRIAQPCNELIDATSAC